MRKSWIKKREKDEVKTQIAYARKGVTTEEMEYIAKAEYLDVKIVREEIANGKMIIPANINHTNVKPTAVGRKATCKINANIGNSAWASGIDAELEKLRVAIEYGADAVMDLSTGEDIDSIRTEIIKNSSVPVGTVPIYEAAQKVENIEDMSADDLLKIIEKQAKQGVDFITVHCGLLKEHVKYATDRVTGIVSRGGSLIARWMTKHNTENPLFTYYDDLLEICRKYDLTLSLGDGLRPGSLADASDTAQFAELAVLGGLAKRAQDRDVQVMIEGPGHIPFDEIEMNIRKQIEMCSGTPFYVLGPLVTDIAAGYDHITSAIGGTMAAYSGASMLCYVTPKEHLGLPTLDDVREGVIAHKIAAHAADIALKKPNARERDDMLSKARFALDWEIQFKYMLDPKRAREYRDEYPTKDSYKNLKDSASHVCSMCGPKFCAMRISDELGKSLKEK